MLRPSQGTPRGGITLLPQRARASWRRSALFAAIGSQLALVLVALEVDAKESEPPDHQRHRMDFGVGASAGWISRSQFYLDEGGPLVEVFLMGQIRLGNWAFFRAEPGIFTTARSETTPAWWYYWEPAASPMVEHVRVTGGTTRLLLDLDVGHPLSFRIGGSVGYAVASLESNVCGNDSWGARVLGVTAGPVIRFGRFDISAEGSALYSPDLLCSAYGSYRELEYSREFHPTDSGKFAVLARIAFRWPVNLR